VGLINPPLASTAVGVVAPQRAGMASGISSTFRQVGIATGIALLGTLFANKVQDDVLGRALADPRLSGHASRIADAVQSGDIKGAITSAPPSTRGTVTEILTGAFTDGLNHILLVAAIIAFAAAVISFSTIRQKDFVHQGADSAAAPA
jgi:hypothetical protein